MTFSGINRREKAMEVEPLYNIVINTLKLRQKLAAILQRKFQMIFLHEMFCISFKFHWSVFLTVEFRINEHWFK